MSAKLNAYAAILAGGVGSRFWPASTPDRPKQLLPLAGPTPLIDETLERAVKLVGAPRVRVVASEHFVGLMSEALTAHGVAPLREPMARGTGPALAWAAHCIEREAPGAVMISMHSDHRIVPFEGLRETLAEAIVRANDGYLCCIGVRPTRPETGYGHVHLGQDLGNGSYEVLEFVEKPDHADAVRYQKSGEHLWNSGIFIWRCADLLDAIREHSPEMRDALPALASGDVQRFFETTEPVAIDDAVMERAGRVATIEARFEWDDLGVWSAVARSRGTDAADNAVVGSARLLEARNNIVWTEATRATVIGVSDLVVVEANGEILVMPRDRAAELGVLIKQLEARNP